MFLCVKGRKKAGAPLLEAEKFRDRVDGWMGHVASFDDGVHDLAAHKRGLVVLDKVSDEDSQRREVKLTAELVVGSDDAPRSSYIELAVSSPYDSHEVSQTTLSYKRTATREVYTERSGDETIKLTLDHSRGTITFAHPRMETLGHAAWPYT